MKLIKLTKVLNNGDTEPITINPEYFKYMENRINGFGSTVFYGKSCFSVSETPKEIEKLINNYDTRTI
jgi:hypothetical protein